MENIATTPRVFTAALDKVAVALDEVACALDKVTAVPEKVSVDLDKIPTSLDKIPKNMETVPKALDTIPEGLKFCRCLDIFNSIDGLIRPRNLRRNSNGQQCYSTLRQLK